MIFYIIIWLTIVWTDWDGKLLPLLTGHEIVDRLSIIITKGDIK